MNSYSISVNFSLKKGAVDIHNSFDKRKKANFDNKQ